MLKFILTTIVCMTLFSCQSKMSRFHKSKILDVTMDPAKVSAPFEAGQLQAFGLYEKSAAQGAANLGGSCPTCGT
ncbi:hypothetical protein N9D31_00480 [Oligoflexaceae bacterium]|nr:hypothetical protein [Oligoflexaceae bacterium]